MISYRTNAMTFADCLRIAEDRGYTRFKEITYGADDSENSIALELESIEQRGNKYIDYLVYAIFTDVIVNLSEANLLEAQTFLLMYG